MKDGLQNISHDRLLMRLVNYIQIIGGIFTGITVIITLLWATHKFIRKMEAMERLIEDVPRLNVQIDEISKGQREMEKKFSSFQKMFRAKKPGGWIYQGDQWKWSENEDK